jgi:hypothetical protein
MGQLPDKAVAPVVDSLDPCLAGASGHRRPFHLDSHTVGSESKQVAGLRYKGKRVSICLEHKRHK